MASPLSAVAFQRIIRGALRSFAKLQKRVEAALAARPLNVAILSSVLDALDRAYAGDSSKLAPFELLAEPLTDLTLQQIEDGLDSVRDTYEDLRMRISQHLNQNAPAASSTRLSTDASQTSSPANTSSAAFPIQSVPKFSGQSTDWSNFYNRFKTIIHSCPSLSVLQKFQYLIDSLDPKSQRSISHLEFNEEFYLPAIQILLDEYDNPKSIALHHAKEIIKLPKLNSKSAAEFNKFVESLKVHFRALQALPEVNEHEAITIALLQSKLDNATAVPFEKHFNHLRDHGIIPTVNQLIAFLADQAKSERGAAEYSLDAPVSRPTTSKPKTQLKTQAYVADPIPLSQGCLQCNTPNHHLYQCKVFLAKPPKERFKFVKDKRLCVNCLRNHSYSKCPSKATCKQCRRPHHTLLHFGPSTTVTFSTSSAKANFTSPRSPTSQPRSSNSNPTPSPPPSADISVAAAQPAAHSILLATSLIKLQVSPHSYMVVRGIIDTAAGGSFISERCVQQLRCARNRVPVPVCGLGQISTTSKGLCSLDVATLQGEVVKPNHPFLIMDRITKCTPSVQVSPAVHKAARHLLLADPSFDKPSRVDCILGADVAALALGQGSPINLGSDMPLAVPSLFGYVIMGTAPTLNTSEDNLVCSLASPDFPNVNAYCALPSNDLHALVERFWQREEPPAVHPVPTEEEQHCERFFQDTTTRDSTGRYQVRLPFINNDHSRLANSYPTAYSRFKALERKFATNTTFKQQYVEFMNDYIAQGHMQLAERPPKYFIPHHGIFKTHGDTSKIRVVFDASAKTNSGVSLNNLLFAGPKLQPLLADVISLFRQFPFVFSCDIRQMFRQILIHPDDRAFQCILWRSDPQQPIQTYTLNTVTYGTTSAPYLALRTLAQLANDERLDFPEAAAALTKNVYVDDIAVGAHTLSSALLLRDQLIALLNRGGFTLRKWIANHPSLLSGIPLDHLTIPTTSDNLEGDTSFLGALWNPNTDTFKLRLQLKPTTSSALTKRYVLSSIAQIFDPCGWLAPFVMSAKSFLQRLWMLPLDWDTPLPDNLSADWHSFIVNISLLEGISLPRPFSVTPVTHFVLHGFCDASSTGYAAVLYLVASDAFAHPALLGSKTRVAPLKTLTIPRLELCGAHLLASLAAHYLQLFSTVLNIQGVHLWSDSQIVLHWVRLPPYKFKIFVSNRVSQIQDWVPTAIWHHVSSEDNPADLASRGADASQLLNSTLWWQGPSWLAAPTLWPASGDLSSPDSSSLELAQRAIPVNTASPSVTNMFDRISSWSTLLRVVKVILAWKPSSRECAPPSLSSVINALCYYIQRAALSHHISALVVGKPCSLGVQRLTPFLDSYGLIRVGGRLANASSLRSVHPILLPKSHPLVNLLIDYYHLIFLHAGLSLTLFQLSTKFWILSARQAVRSRIFRCMICFKAKPTHDVPLMGQLPSPRVTPTLPFSHTGMDFAGPFLVKASNLRKAPELKVYLCIFICFSTKAIHLELASDLSTVEFLDVLQRFISRRGCPAHLYSDCGTNFVGASTALRKSLLSLKSNSSFGSFIENYCFQKGIEFHFNPPSAPHQGGLWERAVQSAKYHLSRLLENHAPTYKTLHSLITRIEGILNSRPISPMSSDPNDLTALTPAHFLLGRSLTAPPEVDQAIVDCTPRQLHWLNNTFQSFWNRWKSEYLPSLLPRSKWSSSTLNLSLGDLVLVDEPNVPPSLWPLGRVVEILPGADGAVRRARIKTLTSELLRPAVKLFKLPIY